MKLLFSLLLIIAFASHFGTIETFAQKRAKPREVIILVFSLSTGYSFDGLEFPLNKSSKGKPECANSVYSSYDISGRAFAAGKNQAKIKLKADITVGNEDCKINRTYTVYRNRKTKIKLDSCGASLIAYYGFKSKKTN
jgi:hypothetical protein